MRRTRTPILVAECSRWQTVGVEGLVLPQGTGKVPDPIKIPAFDDGPMIEAIPRRVHAAYIRTNGVWHCTAVTMIGTPTLKREHETQSVGYTWCDVDTALRVLPGEVGDFVRRNQLPS